MDEELYNLKQFLSGKQSRYVDCFLWELHRLNYVNALSYFSVSEKISACIKGTEKRIKNELGLDATDQEIASYISSRKEYVKNNMFPNEYFNWIDKQDDRLCNFVFEKLLAQKLVDATVIIESYGKTNKYEAIVLLIDRFPYTTSAKIKLEEIHHEWRENRSYKGAKYTWLNPKDKELCEYVNNFLNKKLRRDTKYYSKPEPLKSKFVISDYYSFLLTVDCWLASQEIKQIFHDRVKDAVRKWKKSINNTKKTKKPESITIKNKNLIGKLNALTNELKCKNINDTIRLLVENEISKVSQKKGEQQLNKASPNQSNVIAKEDHSSTSSVSMADVTKVSNFQ